MEDIFHKGELKIQQKMGVTFSPKVAGRLMSNAIVKGAINFIEKQPMCIVSSMDNTGNIWISILLGNYGFVGVPDERKLRIHINEVYSAKDDIFFENIASNKKVGTLFIELASRRRYMINGEVSLKDDTIDIAIEEAYPNCPKYIQERILSKPTPKGFESNKQITDSLSSENKDIITKADTLFVGSRSLAGKMDASHRGGNPGFVEVVDKNTLKIPDYKGNNLYNTMGNFEENAHAGILFIDFEHQKTLQLTGTAQNIFDQTSEEDMIKTGGTGRYWLFNITKCITTSKHHSTNWNLESYSPYNPSFE